MKLTMACMKCNRAVEVGASCPTCATPEDEEFNRVEMESRIKQEYVRTMRKTTRQEKISRPGVYEVPTEAVLEMRDYISVLENLVRELGDRLAKLEKPWVGLTRDEQSFVYQTKARAVLHFAMHGALEHNSTSRIDSFWVDFANAIEAKLKEKNNG